MHLRTCNRKVIPMPSVKNDLFPSKFLAASDLQNKDVAVMIERVETDEFEDNGRKVIKPVVYFQGCPKPMIFNKTNSTTVADITGQDNTDNWRGSRICLFPTMVQVGAQMKEAIRVKRVPEVAAAPVAPVAPVADPQVDDDLADEIPWK